MSKKQLTFIDLFLEAGILSGMVMSGQIYTL